MSCGARGAHCLIVAKSHDIRCNCLLRANSQGHVAASLLSLNFPSARNFHHLRHTRQFFFISLVPAPTTSLSVTHIAARHTITPFVMPPKKSSETGKSKAASTPKTRARTTGAKQTLNEEIRVQQGEKEQLIEDDPDIDLHCRPIQRSSRTWHRTTNSPERPPMQNSKTFWPTYGTIHAVTRVPSSTPLAGRLILVTSPLLSWLNNLLGNEFQYVLNLRLAMHDVIEEGLVVVNPREVPSLSKIPCTGSSADVCINFNTKGKGCTRALCQRKHVCSNCGDNKHAKQHCLKKLSLVKPCLETTLFLPYNLSHTAKPTSRHTAS
jgi:hypothetical protein